MCKQRRDTWSYRHLYVRCQPTSELLGGSNFSNLQNHASINTSSKSKRTTANKTLTSHLFHCNGGIMQHFSSFSIRGTTRALHFIIYFQNLFKKMKKTISSSSNYSGTKMASSNISLAFLSGGQPVCSISLYTSEYYSRKWPKLFQACQIIQVERWL
jgi:hypothetical protein